MSCRSNCRTPRFLQFGMTLVELLIAMVILGLLMALVSQAVYQVAQIARAAQSATQTLHGRWAAGWSVSALMANLVAPTEVAEPVFTGTATQVNGYSTLTLDNRKTGTASFALTLQRGAADTPDTLPGHTALMTVGPVDRPGAARGAAQTVARFVGIAEFAFVNRAGQLVPIWPAGEAKGTDAEVLPRAVVVRNVETGRPLMWYSFQGETARQDPPVKPFWEYQR